MTCESRGGGCSERKAVHGTWSRASRPLPIRATLLRSFNLHENVGICNCGRCVKMYAESQLCFRSKLGLNGEETLGHLKSALGGLFLPL